MSTVSEFTLGKGRTIGSERTNTWSKKYLEVTVKLPEKHTDDEFKAAVTGAEYLIDAWLGEPETPQIPEFDPELLMKHAWKGKKIAENQYEPGSVAWGWDFNDQFPPEVIKVLKKGPMVIDKYEFTMGDVITQTKEKKEPKRARR